MVYRKVVPFDEFYYQLKLMHLFQKHLVYRILESSILFIVKITSNQSAYVLSRIGGITCDANRLRSLIEEPVFKLQHVFHRYVFFCSCLFR
jgi:Ni,Fe-hydrogenase III large subunit